jgi:Tol biopolymer transport system component
LNPTRTSSDKIRRTVGIDMIGTKLAHYEISAHLGSGGMGDVYQATDSKLGRSVAVKFLSESFAYDADSVTRFEREARILASLNHPNIAAIYGLETSNDKTFLVMELVLGETLAERIKRGPIPLDESVVIAKQIAEALEAAHETGIIHRDLKPANIKVTADGTVKVLDFGLAKIGSTPISEDEDAPTLTIGGTQLSALMGTAGYMAPEQVRRLPADKRADIWAFGVVLYEMLTGQRLFQGKTVSDTLAAVLKEEPDYNRVPVESQQLLRWCLDKDPKRRLRDIGDAWPLLEETNEVLKPVQEPQRLRAIWVTVACMLVIVAAGGWWIAWKSPRVLDQPLLRFNVDLGPDAEPGLITAIISPDGTRLVFPARGRDGKQQLATQLLGQSQTTLLQGTEDAKAPFFKPNGLSIGFFAAGKLKTVSGLSLIPASGGTPRALTHPNERGDATHRWPQILPGGQAVLFMGSKTASNYDDSSIEVLSLKTGQVTVVLDGGYFGRYLAPKDGSGYLIYLYCGTLYGVRFDLRNLTKQGTPIVLQEGVAGDPDTGSGQFDFSSHGTFIYLSGKYYPETMILQWLDKTEKRRPLLSKPGKYYEPRISQDGNKLVYSTNSDIVAYDIQRRTTKQLTYVAQTTTNERPLFAPDGNHIVFDSQSTSDFSLQWIGADGGETQLLWRSNNDLLPESFSPDGKHLVFEERKAQTGISLWILPLDLDDPGHPKPGKPTAFLTTPAANGSVVVSPDGGWIAYSAMDSGRNELFVGPFRPGGPPTKGIKISTDGGSLPMWPRNNNKELFYVGPDDRIMAIRYTIHGESFDVQSQPRLWSNTPITGDLEVSPHGNEFIVQASTGALSADEPKTVHITFLLNFFDELHRRLQ